MNPKAAMKQPLRGDAQQRINHSVQSYMEDYQQVLEKLFTERLHEAVEPAVFDRFQRINALRKQAMQEAGNPVISRLDAKLQGDSRKDIYQDIYDELDAMPEVRASLIEAQAKLQDLMTIARKQAIVEVLKAEHGPYGASADDITYTLMHFRQQKVDAADVQRYLDELAAKFSLTSHPTNSTSLAHTTRAIELERILADREASPEAIKAAMDAYIAAPVAGPRKSPLEELEELIPIFDNLYDAALMQKRAIDTALQVSGYADEGVEIRTPMLELEDWSATFDGDGNANATRTAIEAGAERKQAWITGRYIEALERIVQDMPKEGFYIVLKEQIEDIKDRLDNGDYASIEAFRSELEDLQANYQVIDGIHHEGLEELLYLSSVFGFHGSKGNLRHDAKSLQDTLLLLMDIAGVEVEKPVSEYSRQEFSAMLTGWFEDEDKTILNRLKAVLEDKEAIFQHLEEGDDTPLRILERLEFLGEQPQVANKLIIAEATHPADAKTAMALMYVCGIEVANPEASQEIVLLVESVRDVEKLRDTVLDLSRDPVFQKHLEAIGRITVMIAHSDNRRRDGYSAGEVIIRTEGKLMRLQRDLWEEAVRDDCQPLLNMADAFGVPIYIFDGGGNDLMRGAAVSPGQTGKQHGHAAAREHAPTIRTPQNTIQGEQSRLLFGYPESAAMFLEMMVSQSMYAKAAVEKRIGIMLDEKGVEVESEQQQFARKLLDPKYQQDQMQAQHNAILFHDAARKAFHAYVDPLDDRTNPFNALYSHSGAWISTLLANRSSRSNQRGKGDNDREKTVRDIRGDRTPLQQRAITGNLLFQFTGTFHLGLLGQLEAFEKIGEEAAHQMFHSSLPDRTHIVGIAQQLQMTDFDKAWRMMGVEHPDRDGIAEKAEAFCRCRQQGELPSPDMTLAFMEEYGLKLGRAIVQAATGKQVEEIFTHPDRPFEMQDAYRILLPELARQIDIRHASHEAEHLALARQERIFSEYPDQTIPASMEMTVVSLAGALASDVRPALGPLAVRGAKGVATTHEEKAIGRGVRAQPDIRDILKQDQPIQSGIRPTFTNQLAMENLKLPPNVLKAANEMNIKEKKRDR